MKRRTRCHRLARVAFFFGKAQRAEREAPFALANAGAKAGVALQRLDVAVALGDGAVELEERDVLATASECFHERQSPSYSQRDSQVSYTVTRRSDSSRGLRRCQM